MPHCNSMQNPHEPDASQVVESFKLLYDGIALEDGTVFKAAVAELRGDWKFQVAFCPELASLSFDTSWELELLQGFFLHYRVPEPIWILNEALLVHFRLALKNPNTFLEFHGCNPIPRVWFYLSFLQDVSKLG